MFSSYGVQQWLEKRIVVKEINCLPNAIAQWGPGTASRLSTYVQLKIDKWLGWQSPSRYWISLLELAIQVLIRLPKLLTMRTGTDSIHCSKFLFILNNINWNGNKVASDVLFSIFCSLPPWHAVRSYRRHVEVREPIWDDHWSHSLHQMAS